MLKITRHTPCMIGSVLLCVATAGCASLKNGKRSQNLDADPAKDQKPSLPGGAWRQSIGKVILVNERMGFVLVDIGTAPAPAAGTPLQSYLQSEPTSNMSVSVYQRRPYLIADVLAGTPRVGDSVTLVASKAGGASNFARPPADTEPLATPADQGGVFRPRTELSGGVVAPVRIFDRNRSDSGLSGQVLTGMGSVTEESTVKAGEKSEPSGPVAPQSAIPSEPSGSGSAIPGLPLRRSRATEP